MMMVADCYIDGEHTYTVFGLSLIEGSYGRLIEWPELKPVNVTDWHEESGVEPDLSSPALDSRELRLRFAGTTSRAKVDALLTSLRNQVYHNFAFGIGRSYVLRFIGGGKPQWVGDMCIIELEFADDFPLYEYTYAAPTSSIAASDDYWLDNIRLTDYGVTIINSTLEQTPSTKEHLTRAFAKTNGIEYDSVGDLKNEAYEAKLRCLMRAERLDELWHNYDALLYDLVRPEARSIISSQLGKIYSCYFESNTVRRFYPTDKIWLEFDIVLNVIGSTPLNE